MLRRTPLNLLQQVNIKEMFIYMSIFNKKDLKSCFGPFAKTGKICPFLLFVARSIPFVLFVGPFVSAHVGPLNMHFGGVLTCTIVLYINGYAY